MPVRVSWTGKPPEDLEAWEDILNAEYDNALGWARVELKAMGDGWQVTHVEEGSQAPGAQPRVDAREGADVAFTHLPQEKKDAEETRRQIEAAGRRALPLEGDLTRAEFCRAAVEKTVAGLGRLDIVVNNAAYQQSREQPEELSDEQ